MRWPRSFPSEPELIHHLRDTYVDKFVSTGSETMLVVLIEDYHVDLENIYVDSDGCYSFWVTFTALLTAPKKGQYVSIVIERIQSGKGEDDDRTVGRVGSTEVLLEPHDDLVDLVVGDMRRVRIGDVMPVYSRQSVTSSS